MKALILLANGFEQTEALTTQDILFRSKQIQPELASISSTHEVVSSMGLQVHVPLLLSIADLDAYDMLILPGGKVGVENLLNNEKVAETIAYFKANKRPVYAICAAPSILGKQGYLKGKRYTVYPGFETEEGECEEKGVVTDGDLITGRAMAFTIDFACEIVRRHCGDACVKELLHGARGHI